MFGGLGDIAGLMKKARDLQSNLKTFQEEQNGKEFSGSAAGGAVQAVVSGTMELKRLVIKPEAIDGNDLSLTEDLVKTAVNQALESAKAELRTKMQDMTGGLGINLPGLF